MSAHFTVVDQGSRVRLRYAVVGPRGTAATFADARRAHRCAEALNGGGA